MNLLVSRNKTTDVGTIGTLSVDGVFQCFTLENPVREVAGQPVSRWKVYGKTAIPRGTYKVVMFPSAHFGQEMPLLVDVPDFQNVLIHWGNTDKDTEGCILVGSSVVNSGFIGDSKAAFAKVLESIKAAIQRAEEVSITVQG